MIVKIDNLSHDFRGITRVNNKVTFVSGVLPKEIADIRLLEEKKKFNEGIVTSVIEESNDRISPRCPFYNECGGCDILYIKSDKQILYKRDILIDIFKRYANMDINPRYIASVNNFEYRNKITLRVNDGHISLYKDSSRDLININKCLLVNDKINKIIDILSNVYLDGVKEVIIRGNDEIMVIIKGNYDTDKIITLLKEYACSIIYNGKVIYGKEYISINVDRYRYAIYPDSFFQVNTNMIKPLYDKVKEYAGKGNKLLDLYCGAGTIGIYLSDNFNKVYGIEINSDAIRGASLNKEINKIDNISFKEGTTSEVVGEYDVVVVDPPRSGLDNKTRDYLLSSNTKRIVYVSCNPLTLARDVNILKDKYALKDICLFDNFPNTKHMESTVLLCQNDL